MLLDAFGTEGGTLIPGDSGVWYLCHPTVGVQLTFLSSSHEEPIISSETRLKKFLRANRPTFLCASSKKHYTSKLAFQNREFLA